MKKIINLSAAIFISAMGFAQDTLPQVKKDTVPMTNDSSMLNRQPGGNTRSDSSNTSSAKMEDKLLMKGDQILIIRQGDSTVLKDSIVLQTGDIVRNDATVIFKDGSTTKLKNGQMIVLTPPEPSAKEGKSSADTSATSSAPGAAAPAMPSDTTTVDRVIMKEGKMWVRIKGEATLLEDSIKLQSGAVIKKDGSVRFKNGSTSTLKNGQFININPAEPKKTMQKKTNTIKKTTKKS